MPSLEEDLQLEADALGRKKLDLIRKREELATRVARFRHMNPDPAAITRSLTNRGELIQRLSPSKRKELIQLLVERIEVRQVRGVTVRPALTKREFMYAFFRFAAALPARQLTVPDRSLVDHGFTLKDRRDFEWGLIRSDVWRQEGVQR